MSARLAGGVSPQFGQTPATHQREDRLRARSHPLEELDLLLRLIRLALGAERRDLLWLVMGDGMLLAITGSSMGLFAGIGLTRLMTSVLYQTSTHDWAAYAVAPILFLAIAGVASDFPARRATKVDPIETLRAAEEGDAHGFEVVGSDGADVCFRAGVLKRNGLRIDGGGSGSDCDSSKCAISVFRDPKLSSAPAWLSVASGISCRIWIADS